MSVGCEWKVGENKWTMCWARGWIDMVLLWKIMAKNESQKPLQHFPSPIIHWSKWERLAFIKYNTWKTANRLWRFHVLAENNKNRKRRVHNIQYSAMYKSATCASKNIANIRHWSTGTYISLIELVCLMNAWKRKNLYKPTRKHAHSSAYIIYWENKITWINILCKYYVSPL